MFDIEYRPGVDEIPSKSGCVNIISVDESHVSRKKYAVEYLVSKDALYATRDVEVQKIVAATILWQDVENVYIVCSERVLGLHDHALEHVLSNVCLAIGSNKDMLDKQWIITHEAKSAKKVVSNIVKKIRKVYAGKFLAMMPANVATPTMLSTMLMNAFAEVGADVLILGRNDLEKHGFGLIMGIGDSAMNPPCMLVAIRKGKKNGKRIGIVGKGVTFDSGGLAMKPFKNMHDMKFDKIGAVYAAMAMLYFLEHKDYDDHEFVGVFPFVENAVSHRALHPGDVVTSFSGKTVEITNPDAEGRLILADALSYIQKYDVDAVVDIATLTGHASDVSCWHSAMFYTHTPKIVPWLRKLGDAIGERVLDMPYWPDRKTILESAIADLANSPKKCSDTTVAAMFLDEFVSDKLPWVHLDLAHETDGEIPKGHGIRVAIAFIEQMCKKN